jgi:hypothetical protein
MKTHPLTLGPPCVMGWVWNSFPPSLSPQGGVAPWWVGDTDWDGGRCGGLFWFQVWNVVKRTKDGTVDLGCQLCVWNTLFMNINRGTITVLIGYLRMKLLSIHPLNKRLSTHSFIIRVLEKRLPILRKTTSRPSGCCDYCLATSRRPAADVKMLRQSFGCRFPNSVMRFGSRRENFKNLQKKIIKMSGTQCLKLLK